MPNPAPSALSVPPVDFAGSPGSPAPPPGGLGVDLVALLPSLRARALRLTRNQVAAEDLVQDAVERALRFQGQYEPGTNLRAWAQQVLFSVFVTGWRRRRRECSALERLSNDQDAWTVPGGALAPDARDGALMRTARRNVAALPDGFRDVVALVDLEERSYHEAARDLGVPVGTVMSRLHRGRKLLAAKMTAQMASCPATA